LSFVIVCAAPFSPLYSCLCLLLSFSESGSQHLITTAVSSSSSAGTASTKNAGDTTLSSSSIAAALAVGVGEKLPQHQHQHQHQAEGSIFVALIDALHQSDIGQHGHSQVLLIYFEICARYIKFVNNMKLIERIASLLLSSQGIRHKESMVHITFKIPLSKMQ
jgi:hypothetical protein